MGLKSIKAQLIIYLVFFAVFLAIKDRNTAFLFNIAIAVIAALALEAVLSYLKTKEFQFSESAIITGLIIGYVLSVDEGWWKIAAASVLAISSKYLIRIGKKHIFNPAAFGIFLVTVVLGASTEWRATYAWHILVPLGIYFAYKIKKIEVIIGYTAVSLLLFGTRVSAQNVSFWNIFGYFSYFYIFVMVIEPKTTPLNLTGKYIFGAGLAALIFVLTEAGVKFDVELFSLLVMNATVPLLNKLPAGKGGLI